MSSLKNFREMAGYTQEQAAHELGVSRPTYIAWEKDPKRLRVWRAFQIAELFKFDPEKVFDLEA